MTGRNARPGTGVPDGSLALADSGRLRVVIISAGTSDPVAEVTPEAAAERGLAAGTAVWTSVKATEVTPVVLCR